MLGVRLIVNTKQLKHQGTHVLDVVDLIQTKREMNGP